MKTLVICRHAKSDWSLDLPDFERGLNPRGKSDLKRMGELLAHLEFSPDLIVSSPALRALTTAQGIARALGFKKELREELSIYEEGHGNLFSLIRALPDEASVVMIFGHNPTLEECARYILQSKAAVIMPTSAMLCLELPVAKWTQAEPGRAALKWFLIPRMIEG